MFRRSVTSRHNPGDQGDLYKKADFAYVARYVQKDTRKAAYDHRVADFIKSSRGIPCLDCREPNLTVPNMK